MSLKYRIDRFKQEEPGKVFLTDITYLPYKGDQTANLSCIKEVATREIVAYELSTTLKMSIVYNKLEKLKTSRRLYSHRSNDSFGPRFSLYTP